MRRLIVALLVLVCSACGGDKTPTAPTPQVAQIGGRWQGTVQSSFGLDSFVMQLTQTGGDITGTYVNVSNDWNGTIGGTATPTSFNGLMTVSTPNTNGGRCTGSAAISGSASATSLRWTSPGFAGASCGGMPVNLTIVVQH